MNPKVKVTFLPWNKEGYVPAGITILEAARRLDCGFESPCGGAGVCGTDLVQIRANGRLDTALACKTTVETDLEVIVPGHETKSLKTVEGFFAGNCADLEVNPSIRKVVSNGAGETETTQVYFNNKPLLVEQGNTSVNAFGVAVDIGTTTLVSSLVDLNTGMALGSASTLNPLVRYGHDVISRIRHSTLHKGGLKRMSEELISAVNLLIKVLTSHHDVDRENIYHLAAAGNTTMQHIFLNRPIKSIGEYPHTAEILDAYTTSAEKLAILINERAPVTTFSCMSAYVGGDIVAGLIACDLEDIETPALFVDVGTNGEIVLLTAERTIATSCAAGPCFEGMTISSGMRAGEGAIEGVAISEEVSVNVIGGGSPRGICGSGLLELITELLRTGIIDQRGRLPDPKRSGLPKTYRSRLFEIQGKRHFRITDRVSVSQNDIRQVQLARAAIRTGVEFLLSECGAEVADLKNIIIAGGFGYHLSKEAIYRVGLIPEPPRAELRFVGNSSLEGARRMLTDGNVIHKSADIARGAAVIELSNIEGFEAKFVSEMHFR